MSPEQWLDAPVRLLGALPDGSAALYGLNPEETGLDGLLVEWNGSLSYFSNLTYNTGPQIMLSGLSLDDYDGDGADELAAATCTGTGTGVSSWRLDLFEWQDTGTQWQPAGARLADSLTEEELAAQINAAVDSTYDPENRSYLGSLLGGRQCAPGRPGGVRLLVPVRSGTAADGHRPALSPGHAHDGGCPLYRRPDL